MLYFLYRLYFGKFERRVVSGYGRQIANDSAYLQLTFRYSL